MTLTLENCYALFVYLFIYLFAAFLATCRFWHWSLLHVDRRWVSLQVYIVVADCTTFSPSLERLVANLSA